MNHEPKFRTMMGDGRIKEADLPEWLRHAIECHLEASDALKAEPTARRNELLPILVQSDAVICAHIDRMIRERNPAPEIDKLKMLKLKAKAVEMLLREA
jgi:hypothetical protein